MDVFSKKCCHAYRLERWTTCRNLESVLFTDLVHYVRSGDYITALLDEAQNANEFAFALGGLCHYYADVYGHQLGVNPSVPVVYPKVQKKFGNLVTYEQDPTAHARVEFAFDVVQTARGNYASLAYHDFIGFKVADSLMDRAFFKTYSFHLKDLFTNFSRAVRTFRWTVKSFIPEITKAAWAIKKSEISKNGNGITARQFKYKMSKATYNKEFGRDRDKPKFFANLIANIIRLLPKIGPLKKFKIKAPGPVAEKYYIQSFDSVLLHYTNAISGLSNSKFHLVNKDFDTGFNTSFGEYGLTDKAYKNLLVKLQDNKFDSLTTSLKQNIIDFFSKPGAIQSIKETDNQKFVEAFNELKKANSFK